MSRTALPKHVEWWSVADNFSLCIDFLSNSLMLLTLLLVDFEKGDERIKNLGKDGAQME